MGKTTAKMNNLPTTSAATKGEGFFQKTRQIGQIIFLEVFDYASNIHSNFKNIHQKCNIMIY